MRKACILLPTYNEYENIGLLIPQIFAQTSNIPYHELHVMVIDDKSPDKTAERVLELQHQYPGKLHLVSNPNKGLGEAYKLGIQRSKELLGPELVFEMDADLQHDPKLIPLLIELSRYDFDVIIGSRFAPGGSTPDFSLYRIFLSRVGNWMIRVLGGIPRIKDCTSGYRCIRAELLYKSDLSFLSTRGYSFQSSLLCELMRNGGRVVEVPIIFKDRVKGDSKLHFKDQLEFLLNIPKIRYRNSKSFVRFCIVGASGVLVNFGTYLSLNRLFNIPIEYSYAAAIELSILNNFLWNANWTFRERKNKSSFIQKFFQFHIVSGVAATINYVTTLVLNKQAGLIDLLSMAIGIGLAIVVNYSVNSNWTWRETKEK